MTVEERRALTFQIAAQLPDAREDAMAVVAWLQQIVILHWADKESNVVSFCEVGCLQQQ